MNIKNTWNHTAILFSMVFGILDGSHKLYGQSSKQFDINKEIKWINPFPEGELGTAYEIFADNQDANKLFEVKANRIEVLNNWPDGEAPFGVITTTEAYSHYNLELEYKWGTRKFAPRDTVKRDAGLLFHVKGEIEIFPSSLECQIQEDDTGDLWVIKGPIVMAISTDGISREIDSSGNKKYLRGVKFKNYEDKGWNRVRIEVRGDESARFFVNGHLVNELIKFKFGDGSPWSEGHISLQAEGAEVTYKHIRLQNLK